MNKRLKWTLAVAFLLVFAAGAMTGGFVGTRYFKKHRNIKMMVPAHEGVVAQRMREHLRRELELTPDQEVIVVPMIDEASAKLQTIRTETAARVRATMEEAGRQMAPHLTPEQQAKAEKLRERHQHHLQMRRFRGKRGEAPPHAGPPGP